MRLHKCQPRKRANMRKTSGESERESSSLMQGSSNNAYTTDETNGAPPLGKNSQDNMNLMFSLSRAVNYDQTAFQRSSKSLQFEFRKDYVRNGPHLTTSSQTLMHLLKSNIGTGILALPIALKYAGVVVGSLMLIVVGLICTHCMHLLVMCAQTLYVKHKATSLSYPEVAWLAARSGPNWLRSNAGLFKGTVNTFINMMQIGFCVVYLLFVAENIRDFINFFLAKGDLWLPPIVFYEALVALLLLPYTFVKNLDLLAYFTTVANLLIVFGLGVIFVYCVSNLQPINSLPVVGTLDTLPLAFGIAVFAYESVGVLLPIENKMRRPSAMHGLNGVMNTGYAITICVYFATAFYGFLCFGMDIEDSISLSMPKEGFYIIVTPLYAVIIFLSFQLQFYVPAASFFDSCKHYSFVLRYPFLTRHFDAIVRVLLWLLIFVLAAVVPYFDLLVSLIGALGGAFLVIIVPCIIQICVMWSDFVCGKEDPFADDIIRETDNAADSKFTFTQIFTLEHRRDLNAAQKRYWRLILAKNIATILFGLLGLVTGTYCSVRDIVLAIAS